MDNPIFQCDPDADVYTMPVGNWNMNYQTVPALPSDMSDTLDWATFVLELTMNPYRCVSISFNPIDGKASYPQANYDPINKRAKKSPLTYNMGKNGVQCKNCYAFLKPGTQIALNVDLGDITNPTPVATLGIAVNSGISLHGQMQFNGPIFDGTMTTQQLMPYESYTIVQPKEGSPFGLKVWNGMDLVYGGLLNLGAKAQPSVTFDFTGPSLMAGYNPSTHWSFGFDKSFAMKNAIYQLTHSYQSVQASLNASLVLSNAVELSVAFRSYSVTLKLPVKVALNAALAQTPVSFNIKQATKDLACNFQSSLTVTPDKIQFVAGGFGGVDAYMINQKLNLKPRTIALVNGGNTCVTSGSIQPIAGAATGTQQTTTPITPVEPGRN